MNDEYPDIKKWAWRFLRVGIAGGASTVVSVAVVLQPDLTNVKVYGMAILSAFVAGFISSAALAVRDTFGQFNKGEGIVNKMPI